LRGRTLMVKRCLLLPVLSLLSLRLAAQPPARSPVFVNAVWVGESGEVVKLLAADGSLLFEVSGLKQVQAVAIDDHRSTLWVATNDSLLAYGFDGTPQLSIALDLKGGARTLLAVNTIDGSLWLANDAKLRSFSAAGQALHSMPLRSDILGLALDSPEALLWVATAKSVAALDALGGTVVRTLMLGSDAEVRDVSADAPSKSLWVAQDDGLRRFAADGTLLLKVPLQKPVRVSAGPNGGVWAATTKDLVHLGSSGQLLGALRPFGKDGEISQLAADPADGSAWAASERDIAHADATGHLLCRVDFDPPARIRSLAVYADVLPPQLQILLPTAGSYVNTQTPTLQLSYSDIGSGVDTGSLAFQVASGALAVSCTFGGTGATCTPSTPIPDGPATITATVKDFAGNVSQPAQVAFTVDTIPPTVTITSPAGGLLTNQAQQLAAGSISEPATVTVNGTAAAVASDLTFALAITLQEGLNSILVVATDRAGNQGQGSVQVTLDTMPPTPVDAQRVTVTTPSGGSSTVSAGSGSAEAAATVLLTDAAAGTTASASVAADGSFSAAITCGVGDQIQIVLRDAAGNSSAPTMVTVPGPSGNGLPPDPSMVATPIDRTVVTDIAAATAFLYSGASPIQQGVQAGAVDPSILAVLRGSVHDRSGQPIPGVAVKVLGHPELGSTLTRTDGRFDLVANGGGPVIVEYDKPGFLTVQRQVRTPWRDYVRVDDVVLVPLDGAANLVDTRLTTLQVIRGTAMQDGDGARRATLLFPAGATAQLVLPGGQTQPLATLTVRATEFTVGAGGPKAMPAPLPPTSAYTYAVELTADEAIAAGATVQFSQALPFYLENFLNFPVGGIVPTGYYDRGKAAWVASDNGLVLKILSITAGLADLDLTGAGSPADPAALAALGITSDERRGLATLYAAGQSLWRVPVQHFTPFDCNWPFGLPPDATAPPNPDADKPTPDAEPPKPDNDNPSPDVPDDCGQPGASVIGCENQTLAEEVPIVGTPFALHYQSDRVPGRRAARSLRIRLSGPNPAASLKRIDLTVSIAGRDFQQSFAPGAGLSTTFEWDGVDAYGRTLQGKHRATVTVSHIYSPQYGVPAPLSRSFALVSAGSAVGYPAARGEFSFSKTFSRSIGVLDATAERFGGWMLDAHHEYDAETRTVWRGDGSRENVDPIATDELQVVGNSASLRDAFGYWLSPDGSVDLWQSVLGAEVLHIDRNGRSQPVYVDFNENLYVYGMARDRFNQLFLLACDPTQTRTEIRTVNPVTLTSQVAITLSEPRCFVAADFIPDEAGGFFIAAGSVFHVGADGGVTTVVAAVANQFTATSLALAADGSLFIGNGYGTVVRLAPSGGLSVVAGTGVSGFSGDGGPAVFAQLNEPTGISVGVDGSLWVTDNGRLRRIDPSGFIRTVAGGGNDYPNIGLSPFDVLIGGRVSEDPNGALYFILGPVRSPHVYRTGNPFPGYNTNDFLVASPDGGQVYQFSAEGRHLRTLDPVTGAVLYSFIYDGSNLLAGVQDRDGRLTQIQRDAQGNAQGIISPDGQRTALAVGTDGYLQTITDPAAETVGLTYAARGLLATRTDERGFQSTYRYSAGGRLVSDADAAGGAANLQLLASPGSYAVTMTTATGMTFQHGVQYPTIGGRTRLFTGSDGLPQQYQIAPNGERSFMSPDGSVVTSTLAPDPRFGLQSPIASSEQARMPSGLTLSTSTSRAVTLGAAGDPLSLSTMTDTWTANGKTFTRTFDRSQMSWTLQTPGGRQSIATVNSVGRPTSFQQGTLGAVQLGYGTGGRLTSITQGSGTDARSVALTYDAVGRIATMTDPLQQTVSFTYDGAGRATRETLPDGQALALSFDASGNGLNFTPPGRPAHAFAYSAVNLLASYTPPALPGGAGGTAYAYDADRKLMRVTRPGGQVVTAAYDSASRIATITGDRGVTRFAYDPATSNLSSITAPDGGQVSYLYDGSLLTRTAWSGAVAGTIDRTYDADFHVALLAINGGNSVSFLYDADGLLTQAGSLSLQYDPQNGLLAGTALGVVATSTPYNSFAEPTSASAAASGTALYGSQYTRDKLGRIVQKAETILGATDTFAYAYDSRGRLTTVVKNGTTMSTYTYDATGNRLSWTGPSSTRAATYDSQDRLLQYGDLTYTYKPSGELATKTQNGHTMSYQYDAFGNLVGATTPDGIVISYLIDGRNRRIGKRVNGTLVTGYLYRDQLSPAAQLDGSGNVVSVFVYATQPNVPDYMLAGGKTFRIVTDHLGSPRLVVDTATGEVAQRLDYDEFGQVILDTNPGFQPFGFAGGLYDAQVGLVRFGYRDYDPQTGRWTTKDLLGLVSGAATLYQYASDDPVNNNDIMGLNDCANYRPLADWLCTKIKNLAAQLGIAPEFLLALAAAESGWNDQANGHPANRPQHAVDLNNPFGVTHAGGNNIHFSSLDAAFAFWAATYGKFVQGADTLKAFLDGLQNAGYNSANPDYRNLLEATYNGALWFENNCKDKCWGK
jgi:RHS repeat-associated protein